MGLDKYLLSTLTPLEYYNLKLKKRLPEGCSISYHNKGYYSVACTVLVKGKRKNFTKRVYDGNDIIDTADELVLIAKCWCNDHGYKYCDIVKKTEAIKNVMLVAPTYRVSLDSKIHGKTNHKTLDEAVVEVARRLDIRNMTPDIVMLYSRGKFKGEDLPVDLYAFTEPNGTKYIGTSIASCELSFRMCRSYVDTESLNLAIRTVKAHRKVFLQSHPEIEIKRTSPIKRAVNLIDYSTAEADYRQSA